MSFCRNLFIAGVLLSTFAQFTMAEAGRFHSAPTPSYTELAQMFEDGVVPTEEEAEGWYVGRCRFFSTPAEVHNNLLGWFRLRDLHHGKLGFYIVQKTDERPDYFDALSRDDREMFFWSNLVDAEFSKVTVANRSYEEHVTLTESSRIWNIRKVKKGSFVLTDALEGSSRVGAYCIYNRKIR